MRIPTEHIMPIVLIILQASSAFAYFANHNIRQGFYWLAAAVITVTVTF